LETYGIFIGSKVASSAPRCNQSVPWLKLSAQNGSVKLAEVYRVETAGGISPQHAGANSLLSEFDMLLSKPFIS
jgi:hypothetical protein